MKKNDNFGHSFQKVKTRYYVDLLYMKLIISSLNFFECWLLWLADNKNPKASVLENYNVT